MIIRVGDKELSTIPLSDEETSSILGSGVTRVISRNPRFQLALARYLSFLSDEVTLKRIDLDSPEVRSYFTVISLVAEGVLVELRK